MTTSISARQAVARINATLTDLLTGASAPELRIYTGTRPANGETPTGDLLVAMPIASTSVAGAVLTITATPTMTTKPGTATWARLVDGDGAHHTDIDVGASGSGAELELSSTVLSTGTMLTSVVLTLD